ncbi:hypothetical protein CGZ93_06885 [Enemella dayhoffiae]|uniref:Intracellular proteinase inhibitor BsuPI domain-containing protein n=1 Tax=Enemella dayhoffiae TaxID=2016507 RepID=A0A255H578_9ACTN|nr:hypothetical protein CGZ93_06885 [Enemella dayhoffiae]
MPPPAPAPTTGEPEWCDPAGLRVAVDGPRQVTAHVPTSFRVSIVNGTGRRCRLEVTERTFELKVYSGTDRIWSTLDCVIGMPPKKVLLDPDRDLSWQQEWLSNRSVGQCRKGSEPMNSGTYVATAQVQGARPVQLVMQLQG